MAWLLDRSVFSLSGKQNLGFLQAMMTNSVPQTQIPVFTGFLNHKGRIVTDGFVYRRGEEYLVDVPLGVRTTFEHHIRRHFLGTDLVLEDISKTTQIEQSLHASAESFPDPRHAKLGYRAVRKRAEICSLDLQTYHLARMKLGVPETPYEIRTGRSLPFAVNLDLLGGIDFSKGCYLGQEHVSRTKHQGQIRRRIFPVIIQDTSLDSKFTVVNVDLYNSAAQQQGKLLSRVRCHGLASILVQDVKACIPYHTIGDNQSIHVRPMQCGLQRQNEATLPEDHPSS